MPGARCGRCAAAVASMLADGERCPDCRTRGPGFARVAALGAYRSGANAEWLLALKYGGRSDLAQTLGVLLAARLALEPTGIDGRGSARAVRDAADAPSPIAGSSRTRQTSPPSAGSSRSTETSPHSAGSSQPTDAPPCSAESSRPMEAPPLGAGSSRSVEEPSRGVGSSRSMERAPCSAESSRPMEAPPLGGGSSPSTEALSRSVGSPRSTEALSRSAGSPRSTEALSRSVGSPRSTEALSRSAGSPRSTEALSRSVGSPRSTEAASRSAGRPILTEATPRSAGSSRSTEVPPRVLVPVPLHIARRIERGYDQSALLAEACAAEAGIPAIHALRRTRATTVQGALGTTSRAANVRGAFAPSFAARWHARRIAGADVWLVDDVLTSGSTASECARILRRLGARSVSVLCVARP